MREEFKKRAAGAATPILNKSAFSQIEIEIPSIDVQRRIGSILGAYDDLIEVNHRQIGLLEAMAQGLFEEVVVRPVGRLPEPNRTGQQIRLPTGWTIEPLSGVARIIMGQSPPSSELNTNGSGLVFHQGVTDFGKLFPGRRVFCEHIANKRIAEEDDILFSVRAPVGRINCALERTILGRGVAAIRDRTGERAYLLAHLRATFHKTDLIGGGAIYNSVTRDDVEQIPVVRAPRQVASKVNAQLENMLALIRTLYLSNFTLDRSRDLLLPRLVSGELSISATEREPKVAS